MDGFYFRVSSERRTTENQFEDLLQVAEKDLEVALADYLEEVDHVAVRLVKLEKAIDEAVQQAPAEIRAAIEALQAPDGSRPCGF